MVGFITTEENEIGIPENLVLQTNESESYNGVSAKDLATKAINIYESQIPDFKIIGANSYETHSGLGVFRVEYSHTVKDLKLTTLEAWTINGDGDDLYRIIFTADDNEYSNYLGIVNKMIDSFAVEHGLQSSLTHI